MPGYGVAVPATARVVYAQPAPDGHWFHGIHFAEALVADDLHGLTAENLGTVARHAAQP